MDWTDEAQALLKRVPFFMRSLARRKAEEYARGKGMGTVTPEVLAEARKAHRGDSISEDEDVEKLVSRLEDETGRTGNYRRRFFEVKACASVSGCPMALLDGKALFERVVGEVESSGLERRLESRARRPVLAHQRLRVAIAGCPNACSEPQIRDLGLVGKVIPRRGEGECNSCNLCVEACTEGAISIERGYPEVDRARCVGCGLCIRTCPEGALEDGRGGVRVLVGGRLGRRPRLARALHELAPEKIALEVLRDILTLFEEAASQGKRLSYYLEEVGLEVLQKEPCCPPETLK